MTTDKYIALGIGVLLVLPALFPYVKRMFANNKVTPAGGSDLVSIVSCWENLKVLCEKSNLNDAARKLEDIFPLLAKADEEKE